jgi:hypothetical protein
MSYAVKEIFLTLQDEGAHAGRAAEAALADTSAAQWTGSCEHRYVVLTDDSCGESCTYYGPQG